MIKLYRTNMEYKNPLHLVVFELVENILFPTASLVIVTLVSNFTARLFEFYFAIMLNLKSINILLKLICSGDKNISQ